MVDVGAKPSGERTAIARAVVRMSAQTAGALRGVTANKGDAFVAAQLAGIMAAKQTAMLVPLAHPIGISFAGIEFAWLDAERLAIDATAKTVAGTGVELEAMTGASIAALTIYDMLKALERGITIESIRLLYKSGGRSGTWQAPE
jgi:cyclic pyranopterin phosphate synthase